MIYYSKLNSKEVINMKSIEFLRNYETASAAHDLELVMEMIDDEAVYFFSNETTHIGKGAVQKAIQANFDRIKMESYELRNVDCLFETDKAAVCLYEYHWSGEIDGNLYSGSGRGTSVMRRDGKSWKVVHEHLSKGSFGD